jgi:predicted GIY-YIG superfamily endonuclease
MRPRTYPSANPRPHDVEHGPTAVYRLYDEDGHLLYVGCSRTPKRRIAAHRVRPWWSAVARTDVQQFATRDEARRIETEAIQNENPRHNIEPASLVGAPEKLVVIVTPEQAAWVRDLQRSAKDGGRRLSASAIVRAALDQLREQA